MEIDKSLKIKKSPNTTAFLYAGAKNNINTIQSLLELNAVFRSERCSRYVQATYNE